LRRVTKVRPSVLLDVGRILLSATFDLAGLVKWDS
jgi:hypothetical protein